ncbi:TetR/AcrR family transcriptional regulator [Christensenellaceae bacterium OttesenSCG-928-K19]|nr:TetR/AcrR family transcriptional regulator [Christensenellaceae bacterium OttesenSCG-928-K19]
MADTRIQKVSDVARRLFITEGYSRTQIRDIAKSAGISVGAVYLLFENKKVILDFVLKCGIDPAFLAQSHELPITQDAFPSLQNELMAAFYKKGIQLAEPLTSGAQGYSYEDLLSDSYDIISEYGDCSLIFENNPQGCGKLGPFYIQYRARFFDTFMRFIKIYMERGELRELQLPEYSVQLMIETMYYWGSRVLFFDLSDQQPLSPDERKLVCMDALIHAYMRG